MAVYNNEDENFEKAFKYILKAEGGYICHKNDRGGATNLGITQNTYNTFRQRKKLAPHSVSLLTKDEAKKVLFWNYYHNENAPEKAAWGQGLHRYITDEQAASILKDIVSVKKGKKDEALAQEFLERFCEINSIDISDFPIMEGALQRK